MRECGVMFRFAAVDGDMVDRVHEDVGGDGARGLCVSVSARLSLSVCVCVCVCVGVRVCA